MNGCYFIILRTMTQVAEVNSSLIIIIISTVNTTCKRGVKYAYVHVDESLSTNQSNNCVNIYFVFQMYNKCRKIFISNCLKQHNTCCISNSKLNVDVSIICFIYLRINLFDPIDWYLNLLLLNLLCFALLNFQLLDCFCIDFPRLVLRNGPVYIQSNRLNDKLTGVKPEIAV